MSKVRGTKRLSVKRWRTRKKVNLYLWGDIFLVEFAKKNSNKLELNECFGHGIHCITLYQERHSQLLLKDSHRTSSSSSYLTSDSATRLWIDLERCRIVRNHK